MAPRTSKAYKQAENLAERFHGRKSKGSTKVVETLKYAKNVTELGDLNMLVVQVEIEEEDGKELDFEEISNGLLDLDENKYAKAVKEYGLQCIYFPEDIKLASTPTGKQLLVIALDGEPIDIPMGEVDWLSNREMEKVKVNLGPVVYIGYYSDKHHLEGPETQKDGEFYVHTFGSKSGIRPDLIYDTVNCSIELVGGDYIIEDIGIVG